ncbi:MAG: alpha/beta hydrolase [Myxococcales bacterium]|nr:MAG: alpha/beta hydrolase [Myxococcales bacterium]
MRIFIPLLIASAAVAIAVALAAFGGAAGVLVVVLITAFVLYGRGVGLKTEADSPWVAQTKAQERYFTIEGLRVRMIEAGQGMPVLLLHGWADSTFAWRKLIPRLQNTCRLIMIDWPGFGYSDKPERSLSYPQLAKVAKSVLDELGIDKAAVVGNSMGGAAAIQLAADFPERVETLALIDAHAPLNPRKSPLALRLLLAPGLGETAAFLMGRTVYRFILWMIVVDRSVVTGEVVREVYLPVRTKGGRKAVLNQFREISLSPVSFETAAKVQAPTLILWGDTDRLMPLPSGKRMHKAMPGSTFVVLPDTGHSGQWEKPDLVALHLEPFIRQHHMESREVLL